LKHKQQNEQDGIPAAGVDAGLHDGSKPDFFVTRSKGRPRHPLCRVRHSAKKSRGKTKYETGDRGAPSRLEMWEAPIDLFTLKQACPDSLEGCGTVRQRAPGADGERGTLTETCKKGAWAGASFGIEFRFGGIELATVCGTKRGIIKLT